MRKEAEAHAADDKKHRDLIEAKNTADNSIYGAEKVLSDLGDKVPAEIKAEVQAAVAEVKKLKDGEDEPAIRKAVDALSQVVQKVGAAAYQAKPADGPEPEQKPADDNVVDGEVKD
jgi:molecular chaperone DnaK